MTRIPTAVGRREGRCVLRIDPVSGSARGLAMGWMMGWLWGVLAGRDPERLGDRDKGGSRDLDLYPAFLSLTLGLEAKPRFRQEDYQLLGGGEGQEPHETSLF